MTGRLAELARRFQDVIDRLEESVIIEPSGGNDASSFEDAFAAGKNVILKRYETYLIESQINVNNKSVCIIGAEGAEIVTDLTGAYLFNLTSTQKYSHSVTVQPEKGDELVTLDSVTDVAEKDHVIMLSNELWPHDNRSELYKGETTKVLRVDGSDVYIRDLINDNYTETSETVTFRGFENHELRLLGVKIRHLNPDLTGALANRLLAQTTFTSRVLLYNSDFDGFSSWMFRIAGSYQSIASGCSFSNTRKDTLGYGIHDGGGAHFLVENCSFANLRTPVDFSGKGNDTGPARFGRMINCFVDNCNKGGATHGPADSCSFILNRIHNCDIGLQSRGKNILFDRNTFKNISNDLYWLPHGEGTEIIDNKYDIEGSTVFPNRFLGMRPSSYFQDSTLEVTGNQLPYSTFGFELESDLHNFIFENNKVYKYASAQSNPAVFRAPEADSSSFIDSLLLNNQYIKKDGTTMPFPNSDLFRFVSIDETSEFRRDRWNHLIEAVEGKVDVLEDGRQRVVFNSVRDGAFTTQLQVNFQRTESETHNIKITYTSSSRAFVVLFSAQIFSSAYTNSDTNILLNTNTTPGDINFTHSGSSGGGHNFTLDGGASRWQMIVELQATGSSGPNKPEITLTVDP